MERLLNKVAIITGGTKGIGLAIAKHFVDEGAIVVVCSRNNHGFCLKGAEFLTLDVSKFDSCISLVNQVIASYGRIDILVNNAGIMKDRSTKKMTDDEFDSVISTNIKGTFNMTKLVGPIMQNNNYGSIINISSFVASSGNFGQANYVASKAAIEGMSKCWSREFSSHGENVRVNCIAPGIVVTDIFDNTPAESLDNLKTKILLRRFGSADEIANVAVFLASDESSYINNTIIKVDGGIIN